MKYLLSLTVILLSSLAFSSNGGSTLAGNGSETMMVAPAGKSDKKTIVKTWVRSESADQLMVWFSTRVLFDDKTQYEDINALRSTWNYLDTNPALRDALIESMTTNDWVEVKRD